MDVVGLFGGGGGQTKLLHLRQWKGIEKPRTGSAKGSGKVKERQRKRK